MKQMKYVGKRIFFLIAVLAILLIASQITVAENKVDPNCTSSLGELALTIVSGATSASAELPFENCINPYVSLSTGSNQNVPIVANAWVHQGRVVVTVHLLTTQPGPVDVTVWWQIVIP